MIPAKVVGFSTAFSNSNELKKFESKMSWNRYGSAYSEQRGTRTDIRHIFFAMKLIQVTFARKCAKC